jgi:hypothetical protein
MGPLAAALMVSANLALSGAAMCAELPIKANQATQEPRPSGRLCTDMEGKKFHWSWANVPFAFVCDESEKDAKPALHPWRPPQ